MAVELWRTKVSEMHNLRMQKRQRRPDADVNEQLGGGRDDQRLESAVNAAAVRDTTSIRTGG